MDRQTPRIERVRAYQGPKGHVPKYEVFAPAGMTFSGAHSFYAWSRDEINERIRERGFEPCTDPECDCREEA